MEKVVIIGRWPPCGGQNEWGKALSGLTKVVFIERWSYYRVTIIDRFHCIRITQYNIVTLQPRLPLVDMDTPSVLHPDTPESGTSTPSFGRLLSPLAAITDLFYLRQ